MIKPGTVPDATAPPEHHADFLELSSLRNAQKSVSFQEFVRDLRIGNPAEVLADASDWDGDDDSVDENSTEAESIAQTAFDELDERKRHFGQISGEYPFEVQNNSINFKPGGDESLYTFLSLLSWYGKNAGPRGIDGEKVFEDVCAKASEVYLGGPSHRVKSFVFGFPRRVQPRGFADALDTLCKQLGEGGGHRKDRAKLPDQKDGKLDLVAWVEFHDVRQGKLICFGQCATGRNWGEKITELPPADRWCGHWMSDTPTVLPMRSFFVPHRIQRDSWSHSCTFGGVLFDRCRIASLASMTDGDLRKEWVDWSAHVLREIRRTTA